MIKNLLPLFLAFGLTMVLSAQSIAVYDAQGNALSNDMVITLQEEPGHTDIFADLDVENTASSALPILCKKTEMNLVSGTNNTFCWGLCFPPHVYVSPTAITLAAGETDTLNFLGEYYSQGITGTSRIAYTFYDENNPSDSIRIIVDYAYNVSGLAESFARGEFRFSNAYPNPAQSIITFDYILPYGKQAELRLLNLLGSAVRSIPVEGGNGSLQLNVSDLNEGVYFYSLWVRGEAISTRKLIVRR